MQVCGTWKLNLDDINTTLKWLASISLWIPRSVKTQKQIKNKNGGLPTISNVRSIKTSHRVAYKVESLFSLCYQTAIHTKAKSVFFVNTTIYTFPVGWGEVIHISVHCTPNVLAPLTEIEIFEIGWLSCVLWRPVQSRS